jgi:hypothetical protein
MEAILLVIAQYMQFLLDCLKWDAWFYTQWWAYVLFFIPFIFYTMFFMFKWVVLTIPIWLPIQIILRVFGVGKPVIEVKYKR